MSKLIPLSQGRFAIVDDEDYRILSELAMSNRSKKWQYTNFGYARLNINGTYLLMHRFVLDAPAGKDVDHINHNKLDNRKSNLRICNPTENGQHKSRQTKNTSGVIGVHYVKSRDKWQARITINGKRCSLGYFKDRLEAVNMRKDAVMRYYKEYAPINLGELV